MNSFASPNRKIASNYLFTGGRLIADPLIETDGCGRILTVGQCAAPDRLAGVEFYAGILLPGLVDACCGVLTTPSAMRHRRAGTVVVGYTECNGGIPVVEGLILNSVAPQAHFLSQINHKEPFQAGDTVIIDVPLTEDRMVSLLGVVGWCLCSFDMGQKVFAETIRLLRQQGIVPALGSYAPASAEIRPLAEWLPSLAGEPIEEALAWATGCRTRWPGLRANELFPGSCCGLNLLSGCDYRTLCLTKNLHLTRIL